MPRKLLFSQYYALDILTTCDQATIFEQSANILPLLWWVPVKKQVQSTVVFLTKRENNALVARGSHKYVAAQAMVEEDPRLS